MSVTTMPVAIQNPNRAYAKGQRGAILFIVLAFLVVLTMLGLSMFGVTSSEEKMARNFRDSEVAHEAAEAALRDAEIRIDGFYVFATDAAAAPKPISPLAFSQDCTNGLCEKSATQPVENMFGAGTDNSAALSSCPGGCNGDGSGTTTSSPTVNGVAAQPRYLIEKMDWQSAGNSLSNPVPKQAYRITAKGVGRSGKTEVLLQEIYLSN
jgi:type IV pilus assembly protein PilX